MRTRNPFITRGLGVIDFVVPARRLATLSAAARFALELLLLAVAAAAAFALATLGGAGRPHAAEWLLFVVLLFAAVRLLCALCHFAWHRHRRSGQRWAPIIGLVSGCAGGLCLLLPGIVVARWTGDPTAQRIARLFGEPANLWLASAAISVVAGIVASVLIRAAASHLDDPV